MNKLDKKLKEIVGEVAYFIDRVISDEETWYIYILREEDIMYWLDDEIDVKNGVFLRIPYINFRDVVDMAEEIGGLEYADDISQQVEDAIYAYLSKKDGIEVASMGIEDGDMYVVVHIQ